MESKEEHYRWNIWGISLWFFPVHCQTSEHRNSQKSCIVVDSKGNADVLLITSIHKWQILFLKREIIYSDQDCFRYQPVKQLTLELKVPIVFNKLSGWSNDNGNSWVLVSGLTCCHSSVSINRSQLLRSKRTKTVWYTSESLFEILDRFQDMVDVFSLYIYLSSGVSFLTSNLKRFNEAERCDY